MHVIGLSRTGKSKFLEHLIRQDIMAGHGVCVIDPHGELYDDLVAWLIEKDLHRTEHIHLLNPSDPNWTIGFNPLVHTGEADLSVIIDAMVDACVKVWEQADLTKTPLLSRALQVMFGALAANRLTVAEWQFFANWSFKELRAQLLDKIDNPAVMREWDEIDHGLTQRQFNEFWNSVRNRLLAFTKTDAIREIMGQTENVIDFKRCMDEGHVVLVNLKPSGRLSLENARLLGALITNALYISAFLRSDRRAKTHPFYCYIDECGRFITKDVANALDETAKRGLHYVLSHQRLAQLAEKGPEILNAVWAGAQVKVVFNCDDETMAEPLARHLFRRRFDVQRVKDRITQPVTIGYERIELGSWGSGAGTSSARGSSSGLVAGELMSSGTVTMLDVDGSPFRGNVSQGMGSSSSFSSGTSVVEGNSFSEFSGGHDAMRPIIEERATTPMSLEEQISEGITEIRSLPPRHAFLYHRNIGTIPIVTPNVRPGRAWLDERRDFDQVVNHRSAYTRPRSEAIAAIAERERRLRLGTDEAEEVGVQTDDDTFYS